jgi:hypothetical protein
MLDSAVAADAAGVVPAGVAAGALPVALHALKAKTIAPTSALAVAE